MVGGRGLLLGLTVLLMIIRKYIFLVLGLYLISILNFQVFIQFLIQSIVCSFFLSGENLFMNFHVKDLRISRDWVGDHWIDIDPKTDILSLITSTITMDSKLSSYSTTVMKDTQPDGIIAPETDVNGGTDISPDEVKANVTPAGGASSVQATDQLDGKMSPPPLKQEESGKEIETNDKGEKEDSATGRNDKIDSDDHDMEDHIQKNDSIVLDVPSVETVIQKCESVEPMGLVA